MMFLKYNNEHRKMHMDMARRHQRFGIRKLTIGAVSVLLGTLFWLSGTQVQAAQLPAENQNGAQDIQVVQENKGKASLDSSTAQLRPQNNENVKSGGG